MDGEDRLNLPSLHSGALAAGKIMIAVREQLWRDKDKKQFGQFFEFSPCSYDDSAELVFECPVQALPEQVESWQGESHAAKGIMLDWAEAQAMFVATATAGFLFGITDVDAVICSACVWKWPRDERRIDEYWLLLDGGGYEALWQFVIVPMKCVLPEEEE